MYTMGSLGYQLQLFSIPKIVFLICSKHSDIITSFIFSRSIEIFEIKLKTDKSKRTSQGCSNTTRPIFDNVTSYILTSMSWSI